MVEVVRILSEKIDLKKPEKTQKEHFYYLLTKKRNNKKGRYTLNRY